MLLKAVIQSCCEKKNNTFSTQWFLEVMVSELQTSQYNCEDADLWNCNWKSEKICWLPVQSFLRNWEWGEPNNL